VRSCLDISRGVELTTARRTVLWSDFMDESGSLMSCNPCSEDLSVPLMPPEVQTSQPSEVLLAVLAAWYEMFPDASDQTVRNGFGWALNAFRGRYGDYQPIDAKYHDLEHTLQGTLCMARLLLGRHRARARPVISSRIVELGFLAILLHDTGYLKHADDVEGTGAKYTLTHVNRSMDFAAELLRGKGFNQHDIVAVQNMIRCTGVNVEIAGIRFTDDVERICGLALGTSDLLGQMAAVDYVDKLPTLYSEFEECARCNDGKMGAGTIFTSAADLKSRTPAFWSKYVLPKAEKEFEGLFRYLADPGSGRNQYVERIESNIARIRTENDLKAA
jgi:hypothetical protein